MNLMQIFENFDWTLAITYVEYLAAIIGFIYLILEYKASSVFWYFGIAMYALYIVVFWGKGVYAQSVIDAYYLIISIIGLVNWKKASKKIQKEEAPILSMPKKMIPIVSIFTVLMCVAMPLILKETNDPVWLLDGISTGFGIVAMVLLSKGYYQQWIFWMVFNPIVLAISIQTQMWGTACLYVAYTIIAVMGYFKWKKIYKSQHNA